MLIHVEHIKNFTVINNFIIKDKRLSWKAKGIWLYAFSRPDDWTFRLNDMIKQSTDKKHSVSEGIKELQNCGYLIRLQNRNKGKYAESEWTFFEIPFEIPIELKEFLPKPENPTTVFPITENQPLANTDSSLLNKESSKQATCAREELPACQPAAFSKEKIYSCMDGLDFDDKQKISLCMLDLSDQSEQIVSDAVAKYKQRIAEGYIPDNHYGFLKSLIIAKDKPVKSKSDQTQDNRALALEMRNKAIIPNGYFEILNSGVEIGHNIGQKEPTVIEYETKGFISQVENIVRKYGGHFKI